MTYQLCVLLDAISRWHSHANEKLTTIEGPESARLPATPIAWALLGLMHYRMRKQWAWRIFKHRLQRCQKPSPSRVSVDDVLTGVSVGFVPGLPEWSYSLDGNASFIINRATGERLHIDILNGPGVIGAYYYQGLFVVPAKPRSSGTAIVGDIPRRQRPDGCS